MDEDLDRPADGRFGQPSVPLKVKNTFISVEGSHEDDLNDINAQDTFRRRQVSEPVMTQQHQLGRFVPELAGLDGWAQEAVEEEIPQMDPRAPPFSLAGGSAVGGINDGEEEPMRVQTAAAPNLVTAMANLARSVAGALPEVAGGNAGGGDDLLGGGGGIPPPNVLSGAAIPPPDWAGTTTVMMRNLPNKYTQRMLLMEINHTGFLGTFDFLYLPIDPETNANRGYSFLNFIDPGFAWMFKMSYEGRKMNRFNSNKVVSVVPATLQGFEANYAHYAAARVNRGDPAARPLFLREPKQPLPSTGGRGEGKGEGRGGGGKGGRRRGGCGGGYDQLGMGKGGAAWAGAGGMDDVGTYLGFDGSGMPGPYPGGNGAGGCGGFGGCGSGGCGSGGCGGGAAKPKAPGGGSGLVPQFCPSCGGKIQPQFQFCPHCGGSLEFG